MNNQLSTNDTCIGGLSGRLYSAAGDLDGNNTCVNAYSAKEVCLSFGPMRITLSAAAAAELAKHIMQAVQSVGGAK